MAKNGYRSYKDKKHVGVDTVKRNSCLINAAIANDIRDKNTLKYRLTDVNFEKGIDWFNSGLSLEDAPDSLKKDGSFIKGFQRGKTVKLVNDNLYNTGMEYYLKGISLDNIPSMYTNNQFFMSGYTDACNKTAILKKIK